MDIRAFLSQKNVIVDVRASDKAQLLKDLSARAALEVVLDPALVSAEILKREELGTTGLGSNSGTALRDETRGFDSTIR
jgi:mannitol/fructose-specific phosphotransferase system IIA component (Ntr-type)